MKTLRLITPENAVIAVTSDTHGRKSLIQSAIKRVNAFALIHLGDHCSDADGLGLPTFAVRGNCDFSSDCPGELLLEIGVNGEHHVLITHGHHYGVKRGPERLIERAIELGAAFALYGHTHIADIYNSGCVIAANPGSLAEPRSIQRPCFGSLRIKDGRMSFEVITR